MAARREANPAIARRPGCGHTVFVTPALPSAPTPQPAGGFAPNVIFPVLNNEKRRRILVALSGGEGRASSQLAPVIGLSQDATLKHLIELRAAGLVNMALDPSDERRQLYTLSPAILVNRTDKGLELDFGCCVVRV